MFDIIADSACDFTPEMAQKMGVEIDKVVNLSLIHI